MNAVVSIESLDDPRLDAYRMLKDRELARDGQRFIAEGEHIVRRLLESDFPVESVLLARCRAGEMARFVERRGVPILVVPDPLVHEIIGYKFHSGIISCGRRKPQATLEQVVPRNCA